MIADKSNRNLKTNSDQQAAQNKENCGIASRRLLAHMTCPHCRTEKLDYNGLLQLFCPQCGVVETGAFT